MVSICNRGKKRKLCLDLIVIKSYMEVTDQRASSDTTTENNIFSLPKIKQRKQCFLFRRSPQQLKYWYREGHGLLVRVMPVRLQTRYSMRLLGCFELNPYLFGWWNPERCLETVVLQAWALRPTFYYLDNNDRGNDSYCEDNLKTAVCVKILYRYRNEHVNKFSNLLHSEANVWYIEYNHMVRHNYQCELWPNYRIFFGSLTACL